MTGKILVACAAVLSLAAGAASAQTPPPAAPMRPHDLVGLWQGPSGVLKITEAPGGKLRGELFYPGREFSGFTRNGNPISSIEIDGRRFRAGLDEWSGQFDGALSADGDTLAGGFAANGVVLPFNMQRKTDKTIIPIDPSPHKVLFVPVEKDVQLEVLDWGGSGPPLIFLPGNGNTAHVFDDFAPKFTARHHVYGITRRGFGLSSRPAPTADNYDAVRLGDDVLAVIDALKLDRPVIVGHSLGGEEMSSIGTRHPEKVAGLIYLDASYAYAFYDPKGGNFTNMQVDVSTLHRDLSRLNWATPSETRALIQEMQATLPLLQKQLQRLRGQVEGRPDPPVSAPRKLRDQIEESIFTGMRKHTAVKAPALVIVATPHACPGGCDDPQFKAQEADLAAQADAFQAATPSARVVRIAGAQHYVFLSNEAQVMQEMNAFMDGLH